VAAGHQKSVLSSSNPLVFGMDRSEDRSTRSASTSLPSAPKWNAAPAPARKGWRAGVLEVGSDDELTDEEAE
jgi:hypothetical protein